MPDATSGATAEAVNLYDRRRIGAMQRNYCSAKKTYGDRLSERAEKQNRPRWLAGGPVVADDGQAGYRLLFRKLIRIGLSTKSATTAARMLSVAATMNTAC